MWRGLSLAVGPADARDGERDEEPPLPRPDRGIERARVWISSLGLDPVLDPIIVHVLCDQARCETDDHEGDSHQQQ
jgi:hypothetical protein